MSKTATGYLRVSTEGQARERVSLEAQRAKIEAWCLANDIALSGIYVDAGVSGKRADNRPQLQAALEVVCRTRGVLVVYSLRIHKRHHSDCRTAG
jgi:site-specific DNA recombinase